MTVTPGTSAPVAYPQVIPDPGSRLEQLLDMREGARAALKEAEARVKAIEAGIMTGVTDIRPGAAVIDIAGSPHRAALRLRWHAGRWRADSAWLQEHQPLIWEACRKQDRGHWQLHDLGT